MSICNVKEDNGFVKLYNEENRQIFAYGLSGYRKYLGFTNNYFIIKDGGTIQTLDEKGKKIGNLGFSKYHKFEGMAGNNFKVRDGNWIKIYNIECKLVSTVGDKRKNENTKETPEQENIPSNNKRYKFTRPYEIGRLKDIVSTFEGLLFFIIKLIWINIINIILIICIKLLLNLIDINILDEIIKMYIFKFNIYHYIIQFFIFPMIINILYSISWEDVYVDYGVYTYFKINNSMFMKSILFLIKLNVINIIKYTVKTYLILNIILALVIAIL